MIIKNIFKKGSCDALAAYNNKRLGDDVEQNIDMYFYRACSARWVITRKHNNEWDWKWTVTLSLSICGSFFFECRHRMLLNLKELLLCDIYFSWWFRWNFVWVCLHDTWLLPAFTLYMWTGNCPRWIKHWFMCSGLVNTHIYNTTTEWLCAGRGFVRRDLILRNVLNFLFGLFYWSNKYFVYRDFNIEGNL